MIAEFAGREPAATAKGGLSLDTDLYVVALRRNNRARIPHHCLGDGNTGREGYLKSVGRGGAAYNWPVKNNTVVVIKTTTSSQ